VHSGNLEVRLTSLAYGGDAVGRLDDGRIVFVPFCLPGERVRLQVLEERARFVRGRLVELLASSSARTVPRCRHFGTCGGCHYQHLAYDEQLKAKTAILRDQLTRIGHIADPPVSAAVGSPSPWNYRNQVQFHLTTEGTLGFVRAHAAAEPGNIVQYRSAISWTSTSVPCGRGWTWFRAGRSAGWR